MGNQGTAHPGFRDGIELIRSGSIGPVREVHVWTNRPFKYWKQAPDIVARPKEMPSPTNWPGTSGSAPRPSGPTTRSTTRTTGAVLGLRHRRDGRHGLSHRQPAVHGPEARAADPHLRRERRDQPGDLPRLGDDHLRVPRPRRPAARQADLVRRRPRRQAAPAPGRPLPRQEPLRQRLAPRRARRLDLLPERLRLGAGAPPGVERVRRGKQRRSPAARKAGSTDPTPPTRPNGSARSAKATRDRLVELRLRRPS